MEISKEKIKSNKYLQLLQLFTGDDELRKVLNKPFIQGDYVYATDAHTLVQIDKSLIDIPFNISDDLNCSAIIPEANISIKLSVEALEARIVKSAPIVDELIGDIIECTDCDGEGEIECNLDCFHDCTTCGGDGEINKQQPTGKKVPAESYNFILFDRGVDSALLMKIINGVKLLNQDTFTLLTKSLEKHKPFLFQCAEARFLLMPRILDKGVEYPKITLDSIK